jgi:hypothetical protein
MAEQDDRYENPAEPGAQPPAYGTPPPYGTPPAYGQQPAYGQPAYGEPPVGGHPAPGQAPSWGGRGAYGEPSQAVLALVLGIIGLCGFLVLSPFAWVIGDRELRAIDAGRRDPANRGVAIAGKIIGIIGSVLLLLGAIAVAIFVIAAVSLVAS